MMKFLLDGTNPLRGLDLPGLISLLEAGERGYFARLQWTYRFIEKRNPTVRAVKRRLIAALASLKWDIKTPELSDDDAEKKALAEKQAKELRAAYDAVTNLRAALNFLALAELRGFSHLEKIYAREGDDPWSVKELRIVEQWFWARDGLYGPWQYNATAQETNKGETIDLAHYVIHAIDDPADEIFAELAIKQRVNDNDWDGFLEDYGVPPMFIELPPNVTKDREGEFQRAAELAVSRARGSLPNGAKLQSPTVSGSGAGVFKERLEYIDGQIVLAGTSGKLTVLAESGSGNLAGGAQKEAFDEIAQAIADVLTGVMQKQFDLPILERKFPGEPALAYFEFAAVDEANIKKHADNAVKFGQAGYAIDDQELSEKTGYQLTYVGAQAAHTNRPDGSKPIGVAEQTENQKANASGAAAAPNELTKTAEPAKTAAAPAPHAPTTPVGAIAQSLEVAEQFVAPGKSIIDRLLAHAADDTATGEEILAAAEDLLKTIPELAAQTKVDSVVDALQSAMQKAAEETLGGANGE